MGTGDYICITMTGGAPWGFRLQGGKEEKQPLQIAKIRNKSKASKAGLCEGDEVISINGNPCADLAYSEVITLMEGLTDTLQMLIKRSSSGPNETPSTENGDNHSIKNNEYRESTTLQIRTALPRPHMELQVTGASQERFQTERQCAVVDYSLTQPEKEIAPCHKIPPKVIEAPKAQLINMPAFSGETGERSVPIVELQLSLSHDRHTGSSVPGLNVPGAEKYKSSETGSSLQQGGSSWGTSATAAENAQYVQSSSPAFQIVPWKEVKAIPEAEAQGPSSTKVEVILGCSDREKEASRPLAEKGCVDSQVEGGQSEAPPSVGSFGISSEGTEQGEDEQHSEREHSRPHKHRARHARLRRSESLSEKQVKEAKSKCKRIALLLTAAPNPNSKGVLMFKKRRQRARKYTLVSYGTGELERYEDEGEEFEGEEESEKDNAFEVTLLGTSESEIDEDLFPEIDKENRIVTFDWDTGLLEVEKRSKSMSELQMLPESKGKGALMFAKRRQRVDQVTAEQEAMKMQAVHSHEHREATWTENTPKISSSFYQVKQEDTSRMQSHVSKSYIEMSHSHAPKIQQNGIERAPEANMLGQSTEAYKPPSLNRTAKPFPSIQNRAAAPFSPTRSMSSPLSDLPAPMYVPTSASPPPEALYRTALTPVANTAQPALWSPTESTEQIASRDERIAVPAKRTGILQEAKRRNTAKPMFTFKDTPKVSPNPALLSLVQHSEGKKGTATGFESGPEEDYLSLGAEACNFMHIQAAKQKVPPPVAPKPSLKVSPSDAAPISPVWSPPAMAVAQPPVFPAPRSPEVATPASVKTAQPAYPPPQPPSSLNLAGPVKRPQTTVSHQTYTPKMTPTTPLGNTALAGGVGPAFEMPPALSGKGAQLFAKRQSRMEKYVVDSETVQAHMARASSPTPSLPASWKYSSNVRAPPPVAYNPIQSPSYPLAATKPQSKSPGVAKTTKKKPKKALSSLEVMKHQPYQLNASLFTFQPPSHEEGLIPKPPAKFDSVPASKQALPSRSLNTGSPSPVNVQASSVYSVPAYSSQPFFQSNASSPVIESCGSTGYPTFLKQEPAVSSSFTTPRPKFSAKKVGVAAQERDGEQSLSLPGWPTSATSRSMSPVSPVTFQPAPDYFSRPPAAADKPGKRLTPWEAAAKSPLGLVDDAFGPQTIQESIVVNVVSAARRKTLPAPPDDWKQKVAYQPPAPSAHAKLASCGKSHLAVISPARSTMSAPSSTLNLGSHLQYSSYGQQAQTDPHMVSMDSMSDCSFSIADSKYNPYPKGWRRQT